ncbi:unnamed protein product, partial [Rotaria sordida]
SFDNCVSVINTFLIYLENLHYVKSNCYQDTLFDDPFSRDYKGYPEVVLWDTFQEELKNVLIRKNDITVQYLIKAPRLRPEVTSEEEVIVAIIENVFDPLSQFL